MTDTTVKHVGIATLYRVQAADGRGPWRPGLSKHWIDNESNRPLQPAVHEAFGWDWLKKIPQEWHAGCACRTLDGIQAWFTPVEQTRLEAMGYAPVAINVDKIIEENADQVVFARRMPLYLDIILLPWRKAA